MDDEAVNFNPRTPCGVRRLTGCVALLDEDFNPRTPCGVRPQWAVKRCP